MWLFCSLLFVLNPTCFLTITSNCIIWGNNSSQLFYFLLFLSLNFIKWIKLLFLQYPTTSLICLIIRSSQVLIHRVSYNIWFSTTESLCTCFALRKKNIEMWQNKQNQVCSWVKESRVPKSINTLPQALQRGGQPSPQHSALWQTRSDLNHKSDKTDDSQPRWSSPSTQRK